jgi:ribonucleotide reductase beta subunit family protein with ferritin-like domain
MTSILDKYTFDPRTNPLEKEFYDLQLKQFWNDGEYNFVQDAIQFKTADDFIKRLFEGIICFFLVGDGKVSDSLVDVIKSNITNEGMSEIVFLAVQLGNEMTHAVTYNTSARTVLGEKRLQELLEEIETLDCVKNKINFISEAEEVDSEIDKEFLIRNAFFLMKYSKWNRDIGNAVINMLAENKLDSNFMKDFFGSIPDEDYIKKYSTNEINMSFTLEEYKNQRESLFVRLFDEYKKRLTTQKLSKKRKYVRLACGEGLFFMTQFILIGLFKSLNLFEHFCGLNNHIFKDEILHANHKCALAKNCLPIQENFIASRNIQNNEDCMNDIREAYRLETEFLRYLLFGRDGNMIVPEEYDIDFDLICDAAKMRANHISLACGLDKLYEVDREFPGWCSLIGGSVKNNFFEIRLNQSYKTASDDASVDVPQACSLDDDF